MPKLVAGHYDATENILHLWFPRTVELADPAAVATFFDEVTHDWIDRCPTPPYLLVCYRNLHIRPSVTDTYAASIAAFQSKVLGTFRYEIPPDLTGVAVSLGNMRLQKEVNMYPSELAARDAIRAARAAHR